MNKTYNILVDSPAGDSFIYKVKAKTKQLATSKAIKRYGAFVRSEYEKEIKEFKRLQVNKFYEKTIS